MNHDDLARLGVLAGTMGKGARLYHVGFVVPDLDVAIADLEGGLGIRFAPPMDLPFTTLYTPGGPRDVRLRLTYSTRPSHIELIQDCPSSLWSFDDPRRGHHVGVWADDVDAEAAVLDARGWDRVWWASGEDGKLAFSYHDTPYGFFVELVASAAKSFYPGWFASVDSELAPN